jgi:hypothetical protein
VDSLNGRLFQNLIEAAMKSRFIPLLPPDGHGKKKDSTSGNRLFHLIPQWTIQPFNE